MKKLLLCTAALTMFAGSSIILSKTNTKADNINGNNNVTNTMFKIDNSGNHTFPVDPITPQNELPNDGKNNNITDTNSSGELTLDAVPTDLNFGQTTNQAENGNNNETIYNNQNNNGQYYYTQVTDNRNNKPGWNLTATLSNPMQSENGAKLKGASITFNSNDGAKPAYGNATETDNDNQAPTNNKLFSLSQNDGTKQVMQANQNQGGLTWFDLFNSIQLKYGQSQSGTYNGTITWNLTSGASDNGVNSSTPK
ncbi:WxL domain-containing protein [Apilactobacillus quenuiae]|uniref:WxL domain-containing protein n=1 Tax=Apilactobacillus quenuiae TaxID=2008377 RepID=UPI000D019813|nr:WxL domain-containing protein [Apilactobacillus quenuiae]